MKESQFLLSMEGEIFFPVYLSGAWEHRPAGRITLFEELWVVGTRRSLLGLWRLKC
jgi:hypothetical protein